MRSHQSQALPSPPSISLHHISLTLITLQYTTYYTLTKSQGVQYHMESVVKLPPLGVPLSKQTTIRSRSISADNKLTNNRNNVENEEENSDPIDSFVVAKEGLQVISPWLVVESHVHKG